MNKSRNYILLFSAASILTLLYFLGDARTASFFPRCPFNYLTGLFCPGCGSQRAFSAMLHAQVAQAANYNLLFVISVQVIMYSGVVALINAFKRKKVKQLLFYSPLFAKLFFAVVLVFWVARNIPAYPFNLLAPHT